MMHPRTRPIPFHFGDNVSIQPSSRAKNDTISGASSDKTGGSTKLSRNRHKKEQVERGEEKLLEVETEESRMLATLEAQRKAEEVAAAAEAIRVVELQRQKETRHAALLQAKQQLELHISAACQRLDTNFVQVTETHKQLETDSLWKNRPLQGATSNSTRKI